MGLQGTITDIQRAVVQLQEVQQRNLTEFKRKRLEGTRSLLKGAIRQLVEETKGSGAEKWAFQISQAQLTDILPLLDKIAQMTSEQKTESSLRVSLIPADVRGEIDADLAEIQACMGSDCFRSAIILCGRVMETALHRKYYDATGQDLLEKAPGIGLGNLIARLSERGVKLDPGLTNQIHLINQVRVFSVHTKQDAFIPSKMQAQAIVLYTQDILEKLFK